jgi:bla regulator protein BlaR1
MLWLWAISSNVIMASLVAVSAWLVQRRLGRPALAHVLWVLALMKLVTPPLARLPLTASPGTLACVLGVCGCEHHGPEITFVRDELPWIVFATWAVGAGVTLLTAGRRWHRFRQLLAHARPATAEWQSVATQIAAELSLGSMPQLLVVPGRLPPLVVPTFGGPRLLLPSALVERLSASQRRALLLHELTHLKRGDHLVRLLELAISVVFWWLPIVGVIGRQLRSCEEACCDAEVVSRLPGSRRDYARLLLDVLDFADPLPRKALPQATAMSVAEGLERRLLSILGNVAEPRRRTWPVASLALVMACASLPCGVSYETVARGSVNAAADGGELCTPASPTAPSPTDGRTIKKLSTFCCPSWISSGDFHAVGVHAS